MKKEDLLNLINDDDLGLLSIKQVNTPVTTEERLVASFLEINNFVETNKREPQAGGNITEHQLASRLAGLRADHEKVEKLLDFDEYDLLCLNNKEITSLDDIFADDEQGILCNTDEGLFKIDNIVTNKERSSPEYVSRRKVCQDFEKFEPLFKQCQSDLALGKRKLTKFSSEKQVVENSFFVLNGILLFIEKIDEIRIDKFGKMNGRQKCVFENGTESNMLIRSLVQRLYENGHAITENSDTNEALLLENFNVITKDDGQTGYIYIVKSLSENPKIHSIENLFKIGFSTTSVEERVKDAIKDPTYLMAPVKIVTTFQCFNFDPQKLEQLLHKFFGTACLNLDIFDDKGKRFTPREWFIAPLDIIEKSIELIISGGIINFRYDSENQKIILR